MQRESIGRLNPLRVYRKLREMAATIRRLEDEVARLSRDLQGQSEHLDDHDGRLDAQDAATRAVQLNATVAQEAAQLAEVSRVITKRPVAVLVEAPDAYGNLAALGMLLHEQLGPDSVAVLARDEASQEQWRARGVRAHVWHGMPGVGHGPVWELALRAAVSVFEHHPWWRKPDRLVLSALLEGSQRVQLWHGSAGPIDKDVALAALAVQGDLANFADIATTASGYSHFVTEPRSEARRRSEFAFEQPIADVDVRMRAPVQATRRPGPLRVLIAPTFPEGESGPGRLAERMTAYVEAARGTDAEVRVRHHPWTPEVVRAAASDLPEVPREVDAYDVLADYDVIVTDYSSLATDMLLLGRRVVLDLSDSEAYLAQRSVEVNEDMLALCDQVTDPAEAMRVALSDADPLAEARAVHAATRLEAIGGVPGQPTVDAIKALLDAVR